MKLRYTLALLALSVFLVSCGGSDGGSIIIGDGDNEEVTVVLVLPNSAPGEPYGIFLDNDINPDNGYVKANTGITGSGTQLSFSLGQVSPGTYVVYAAVCVVSNCDAGPVNGDWFGVYGNPMTLDLSPQSGDVGDYVQGFFGAELNAVVPSSGRATFNIVLDVYDEEALELNVGEVSALLFIDSYSLDPLAINFYMPNGGGAGTYPVVVRLLNTIATNAASWQQLADQDPTDPDNDYFETAIPFTFPIFAVGSFVDGDMADGGTFTLEGAGTFQASLDWNNEKDLDFVVFDAAQEAIDECSAATYEQPEVAVCTLPAGTYYIVVADWDALEYDDYSVVTYLGLASLSAPSEAVAGSAPSRPSGIDPAKAALLEGVIH